MAKLRFNITMSLDGYAAGPHQSVEHPLGERGEELHGWVVATRSWRASHGQEGGEDGSDDERAAHWSSGFGATIMGRNMFGAHPRRLARRGLAGLVGRGSAVPPPGLRADPPRARSARDAGRHDVPLRDRRHRVRARARPGRRRRQGHHASAAAPRPGSSTCGRAWSTSSRSTSRPSCSAAASGCSTTSPAAPAATSASPSRARPPPPTSSTPGRARRSSRAPPGCAAGRRAE